MNGEPEGRCLGLIGGLGVGATVHYYQSLVKAHANRGFTPNLVILHADVSRILRDTAAGGTAQMARYLSGLIDRLAKAGAVIAAMPAITPHICMPELVELSPIPLVNLIETIVHEVHARGLKRVAIFGTRFTIETEMFGHLRGLDIVKPTPEEVDFIHDTYMAVVDAGTGKEEQYEGLRRIAHTLCDRDGVEAVILGGTELSLLFNEANTDFPHIDCARVHIEAIMDQLFTKAA